MTHTQLPTFSSLTITTMSELDADLYGDLYENDEADFASAVESHEVKMDEPKAELLPEIPPSPTAKPPEAKPEQPATILAPQLTRLEGIEYRDDPTATSAQSGSSPQNAPQQIPTYQQPSDYLVDVSHSGSYDRPHMPERSIRPSEMKDEGKMFIGGLNWDTTDESLRNYFAQFGKVDACTIMRDAAGRSRCFAFLTFEDPASVNAVMVREHFLDGKIIDPKRAIPRQEHQRATKLFIGGLAGSVTSESMREFFSQFGKVIDSTVMLDRETGRSKGFGFVSFEDTNVQPFLGFGNLQIDGKLIDVKLAQPRYQRDNFQEDGGTQPYGNPRGGAGASGIAAGGGFNGQTGGGVNFPGVQGNAGPMGATPGGNTPFDPQALAQLYTRMFQMAGAGGMMGGMGMSPMIGGMGTGMNTGGYGGGMGGIAVLGWEPERAEEDREWSKAVHRLAQADWARMFPVVLEVLKAVQEDLADLGRDHNVPANVVSIAITPMRGHDCPCSDADLALKI
ncbi:hypothetical protein JVU11DRAFT_11535 [Chiua virens]|nr:hypothetical protein JVU11DRAFT_11535 [Chiua virens]